MLSLEVLLFRVLCPLFELLIVLTDHLDQGFRVGVLLQFFDVLMFQKLCGFLCEYFPVIIRWEVRLRKLFSISLFLLYHPKSSLLINFKSGVVWIFEQLL